MEVTSVTVSELTWTICNIVNHNDYPRLHRMIIPVGPQSLLLLDRASSLLSWFLAQKPSQIVATRSVKMRRGTSFQNIFARLTSNFQPRMVLPVHVDLTNCGFPIGQKLLNPPSSISERHHKHVDASERCDHDSHLDRSSPLHLHQVATNL